MALVSLLNCFKALVNEVNSLIESNLTKPDLTWNLMVPRFSIFKIIPIRCISAILHINWGYFNTFGAILSNFYDVDILLNVNYDDYNWYQYESSIIMMPIILSLMYEIGTMMLLMYYCFMTMLTTAKRNYIFV